MKTFIFVNESTNIEVTVKANTQLEALEKLKEKVNDVSQYQLIGAQG